MTDRSHLPLGKRPAKNAPALHFGQFACNLSGSPLPSYPSSDQAPNLTWPMDDNDQWGDCVVAGVDHALQAIYTQLGFSRANWTDAEILAYYRTQNPDFDPTSPTNGPGSAADGGMDIQTFLEYLVAQKVILGFARVDATSTGELEAAIYVGLGMVTGETLQVAQQSQDVWDYVAGSDVWGGHCTVSVGYATNEQLVTWGEVLAMTPAFVAHQVEEAWFVLTQAHVDHPSFRGGFDLAGFAAAYKEITGDDFPVPVPPSPTPPPGPGPTPVPPPTPQPHLVSWSTDDETLAGHIQRAAARHQEDEPTWITNHLDAYFREGLTGELERDLDPAS